MTSSLRPSGVAWIASSSHAHLAEGELAVLPRRLVVVARDVDHVGALARLAHDLLHHVVVRLRPVPPALQPPAVDDVADQVEMLALVPLQEIEQQLGLAAARAEMDVRQEDRAVAGGLDDARSRSCG